jgi:hypothetical protein
MSRPDYPLKPQTPPGVVDFLRRRVDAIASAPQVFAERLPFLAVHWVPSSVGCEVGPRVDFGSLLGTAPWSLPTLAGHVTEVHLERDALCVSADEHRTRLFSQGAIEAITCRRPGLGGETLLTALEVAIVRHTHIYLRTLERLNARFPLFARIRLWTAPGVAFDTRTAQMDAGDLAPGALYQDLFEDLRSAAGWSGSPNYPNGRWSPGSLC